MQLTRDQQLSITRGIIGPLWIISCRRHIRPQSYLLMCLLSGQPIVFQILSYGVTGAALPENNEASAELATANGGTFTACSARPSSQSRYRSLDQ